MGSKPSLKKARPKKTSEIQKEQQQDLLTPKAPQERIPHPLSLLFPAMNDDEFLALKADIKANGMREKILLHADGRILDGRHRYRAYSELVADRQAEPFDDYDFEVFDGEDEAAIALVLSKNLHRRHLGIGQRAMVAARIATAEKGERTDLLHKCSRLTIDNATASLGVSPRSVSNARTILKAGCPELIEAVDAGEYTVTLGATYATFTHEEQLEILEGGDPPEKEKPTPTPTQEPQRGDAPTSPVPPSALGGIPPMSIKWDPAETARRQSVEAGKTVFADPKSDPFLCAWAKDNGLFVDIDKTPLRAPEGCTTYRGYMDQVVLLQPNPSKALANLKGKVLVATKMPTLCYAMLRDLLNGITQLPTPLLDLISGPEAAETQVEQADRDPGSTKNWVCRECLYINYQQVPWVCEKCGFDLGTASDEDRKVALTAAKEEYYTPDPIMTPIRKTLGRICLDPASWAFANQNVKARIFYTREDDALTQNWHKGDPTTIFMNPPFTRGLIDKFVDKFLQFFNESSTCRQGIVLVNSTSTSSDWFQKLMKASDAVCFPKDRIGFQRPDGTHDDDNRHAQAVFYFAQGGPWVLPFVDRFMKTFTPYGACTEVCYNDEYDDDEHEE